MADTTSLLPLSALSVPTIHLNGTSADVLADQLMAAVTAIRDALRKLDDAAPHARDYYLRGNGAFTKEMQEHLSRVERIQSVNRELSKILEVVSDVAR